MERLTLFHVYDAYSYSYPLQSEAKSWYWFKIYCKTCKPEEIKTVSSQGNQPWVFVGKTDAEAEAPILWPPDAKSQLIGKKPWS